MTESSLFGGLAVVFLAAILTNNILLSKFLGMCSFIAISRNMRTAVGMGIAVTFVTLFTAMINYLIYYGVLVPGAPLCAADLTFLTFLIFIMMIAGFVQLVEMFLERFIPLLYFNLGIFLPLITVNCAILGVNLLMIDPDRHFGFAQTAAYALGSGLGYLLAICLMAGIRQRLAQADIPRPLRGLGITVIITGLMAMAFMGFTGMVDL
ncbi:MAG: NADH:ubiquinone reductase (Na(+)-transporting) subunit E [Lentisphaeria bacterium]|nr:NADH:ubiquinone reductase (Na(+)-transporting) subunit E [Lentisphaeria bacterium]